ncbi:MAG: NERD domain-containing protein [Bacilli bacterium]|nr:NERD domain-containing protein [Bacilli bacterium]
MSQVQTILIVIGIIIFLIILIGIAFIKAKGRYEHLSGESGENTIANILNNLKEDDEVVINDFLVSRNKEGTHSIQIDHIFISHRGIFVIETKDYKGKIYGNTYDKYWTQYIGRRTENRLYNPIMQNETHCRYIDKLFHHRYMIDNIVIFLDAELYINGRDDTLFNPLSFVNYYCGIKDNTYLSTNDIDYISNKLYDLLMNRSITKEEHIRNIRRDH